MIFELKSCVTLILKKKKILSFTLAKKSLKTDHWGHVFLAPKRSLLHGIQLQDSKWCYSKGELAPDFYIMNIAIVSVPWETLHPFYILT